MINFSDVSSFLAQSAVVDYSNKVLIEIESDLLFSIACEKDKVFHLKKNSINKLNFVVIANNTNFGKISSHNRFGQIRILQMSELLGEIPDYELLALLSNSLVITTSNIFAEIGCKRFGAIYEKLPSSIFVIHDYDNHHWFSNNIQSAIFSDVYVPSHQSDCTISSRVNPNILGGIPCGSNQWSINFIKNNQSSSINCVRSEQPLGKYYFYEKFIHRNKAISTLSQNFPDIGLVEQDFHQLSEQEKWNEWCGHKLHWIIPVLNDLPIRFFDALITGGLPLIPKGLLPYVSSLNIPRNFFIPYGPLDLIDPKLLIEDANKQFNIAGEQGILERQDFAIKNFHVDIIIEKIISEVLRLYDVKQ